MSEYQFSAAERWAVFSTHGDTCYLCSKPLDYTTMQVDHVVPEHLLKAPAELAKVLKSLGLPGDFDINSFENWLPAHGPCNRAKAGMAFTPAPIVVVELEKAARKADQARAIVKRTISDRKLGNALAVIEVAASSDDLPFDKIQPALEIFLQAHPEAMRAVIARMSEPEGSVARLTLGFETDPSPLLELRLTPFARVVYYSDRLELVTVSAG